MRLTYTRVGIGRGKKEKKNEKRIVNNIIVGCRDEADCLLSTILFAVLCQCMESDKKKQTQQMYTNTATRKQYIYLLKERRKKQIDEELKIYGTHELLSVLVVVFDNKTIYTQRIYTPIGYSCIYLKNHITYEKKPFNNITTEK